MGRAGAVWRGWRMFVRPVGMIFPGAVATISMCPKIAHASAEMKNRMMTAPMARPAGDAGVSTISSAAGRNSSSVRERSRGTSAVVRVRTGMRLADFLQPDLRTVHHGVATADAEPFGVAAVLDDAPALDGDDAVDLAHRR